MDILQGIKCFKETHSIYNAELAILKEIWRILYSFRSSDRLFPLHYMYIQIHIIPKLSSCVKCETWQSSQKAFIT